MARRIGGVLLALVIAAAGVIGLVLFLQARDDPDVGSSNPQGPGVAATDSDVPARAQLGSRTLTRAQLIELLEAGNVLLVHGERRAPAPLVELAESASGGPIDPALMDAGQAVIVVRAPGASGVEALAYRRRLRTNAADPALASFVDFWLGQGTGRAE